MTTTHHAEGHSHSGELVRDIVIGMADGLTVPFALAAGLTGVIASSRIVVTAGLAEIAAGSIAMGLGGYLAARSDAEHYASERAREEREVVELPDQEKLEITQIFEQYGIGAPDCAPVVEALSVRPKDWVDFMMRFELGLEEPEAGRALRSASTIAGAYITGGLIPLCPYFFVGQAQDALLMSVGVTVAALGIFGYLKGRATSTPAVRNAVQTVLIGGLAAAAAFLLARAIR